MEKEIADKILRETEIGYDSISDKFSSTRKHFWREMEFIKDYTCPNDVVLDFGCGNGRLLDLIGNVPDIHYYGTDISQKLIALASEKHRGDNIHFSTISSSQTTLPFESDFFNTTYSIAVMHHIPSRDLRLQIAKELFRVTKPGGHIVIDVWNLWQKKYFKNIAKNWKNKIFETLIRMSPIRSRGSRSDSGVKNLDWNDCRISFAGEDNKGFHRYHHAFTSWELNKLFSRAGFEIEKCEVVGRWHSVLIGKKK